MKNFSFRAASMLLTLIIFTACSSDDSSNDPITCPEGYTGTNCEIQLTPAKIKVTKIRVKYFPNMNGDFNWDFDTAPDIFVRLGLGNGDTNTVLLYDSGYYEDVLSDGITTYDFIPEVPIEIKALSTHIIILGDYDTNTSNELMGGFTFIPYNSTNQFPETITVGDLTIPLYFELSLSYEW